MIRKDKIAKTCIFLKQDVVLLKETCDEYHISFCNIILNIVHEYCDRLRRFSVSIIDSSLFDSHIILAGVQYE